MSMSALRASIVFSGNRHPDLTVGIGIRYHHRVTRGEARDSCYSLLEPRIQILNLVNQPQILPAQ